MQYLVYLILGFLADFFSWIAKKFTSKTIVLGLQYAVEYSAWALYALFFAFAISLINVFHNAVISILDLLSTISDVSVDTSCLGINIQAGINASGLIDGLSAGMPVITSALSLYFVAIFWLFVSNLKDKYVSTTSRLIGQLGK